ncbi:MAG TPA: hypothetical protein PLD10_13635 [Rhodopila sp.]|nr:hypothetical protein [Rhodopila sp.]
MTTQVIITSPKPNHGNVRVITQEPATDAPTDGSGPRTINEMVIPEGTTQTFYVHAGQQLLVVEEPISE